MTASKVNPNVWQGEEVSGGIFGRNSNPTSTNSPDYRGKVYLAGIGWFWLSGWEKKGQGGEYIQLRAQEMTDEQAAKFCKPRPKRSGNGAAGPTRPMPTQDGIDQKDEIPF